MSNPLVLVLAETVEPSSYMYAPRVDKSEVDNVQTLVLFAALIVVIVLFGIYRRRSGRVAVSKAGLPPVRPKIGANTSAIRAHDPKFDTDDFLAEARAIFDLVHKAWTDQRPMLAEHVMGREFWAQHAALIDDQRSQARQHVEAHLKVHDSAIRAAVTISRLDSITVRFLASCADYEIDGAGRVIGDKRIRAWEEDWTFQRALDSGHHLPTTWCVTQIQPVIKDRFGTQRAGAQTPERSKATRP